MRYDAFHRKLKAKDAEALRMQAAVSAAGASICAYWKEPSEVRRGETFASGAIRTCLREYGSQIVILAIRTIVESGDGNRTLIRGDILHAICFILRAFPAWCAQPEQFIRAFDRIDLYATRDLARRVQPGTGLWRVIATLLTHDISHQLGTGRSAPHGQASTRAQR